MGATTARRAKTPVFFVGQLELKTFSPEFAQSLAQQYQDILPLRSYTPSVIDEPTSPTQRCLRRIKCQQCLRDLVKEHSELTVKEELEPTNSSDCETLLGPESPTSSSPPRQEFSQIRNPPSDNALPMHPITPTEDSSVNHTFDIDDGIGLQICMNLLSNELTTTLSKQSPGGMKDRGSELQILLMIEAYEAIQQQIRQQLDESRVRGDAVDYHVLNAEKILEQWLGALYAVYDRSQQKTFCSRIVHDIKDEEYWPSRRSVDSDMTYVD
ncbi:uncharacterized protein BP5553_09891 [Venustampulla echinocandica]|uniref:Uncharacterized protein n=1 Tax=Venustampulla echinocandica TaxID=2656787 RepID=A0A370TB08_9HELO|nr:uncharacterized protein BP5553_09891 [Venustampulla echinocandica]RDL31102.1 hypothetical protein BP5553_09891 [Venustampulla echinocandica]